MGSATTVARKVVSSSTLIGPFKIWARAQIQRPLAFALKFKWANQSWGWNHLVSGRCRGPHHKNLRKAEEANFKANFLFFTSLSTAKAHGFGVKFIELYGTVDFIAIRDFSLWGESDLWSDFWPAMDGVVCLSICLEGGVTVSNNSTKRRQNGFKIVTRDKFATQLRYENFISNEIVIYSFFYDRRFSHAILYIHKLSHTPRILSLGSLCNKWCLYIALV